MILKNTFFIALFSLLLVSNICAQDLKKINITTNNGHAIKKGASGFNVRIADKIWSYTHPDFVQSVKELKPGWLRYFSGTMGDAFSSATGQYDLDYISMLDKPKPFLKGHRYVKVKGPHRIIDLYELLSEVNGKLIITVNAFTESPEMILELARFCKNNNIEVAVWQFCNEPYFYVPNRNRFWWNDGFDYAAKMKPYAEAIQQIFPDAQLTLNYTWDGVWTFMKEIDQYQKEHGAYWNVFSKHSYAPHTGKKDTREQAYKRANTKLLEATSSAAMSEIEDYTWKDVPMIITEFGVWNKPLNGIYSSIYNIEYVMRQLAHTNTQYVGAHEVSNKYYPGKGMGNVVENAFENKLKIETDTVLTGIRRDLEGKAYKIYNEAVNNSEYLYHVEIANNVQVDGLKNTKVNGMFAQGYKGSNGYNYLVVSNRSAVANQYQINIDEKLLKDNLSVTYIAADSLNTRDTEIKEIQIKNGILSVKPFSLSVLKWKTDSYKLEQPTIYKATVEKEGVLLKWGAIAKAKSYKIHYGTDASNLSETINVPATNTFLVNGLHPKKKYFFSVEAQNDEKISELSNAVSVTYQLPIKPEVFKVSRRDNSVTLFWRSVPNATSYLINYVDANNKSIEIDTDNVFGYRIEDLKDNTNYQFTVTAYNGLGKSISSEKEKVFVSSRVPYSPRNVSAIHSASNSIEVKWHPNKEILPNTYYNVYRGTELHEFTKVASGIKDTVYVDASIKENTQYYYTVKAETEVGESNFHPNIATAFSIEKNNQVKIQVIETQKEGYLVKVVLNQLKLKPEDSFGAIINNVSYLNVEHIKISGIPDAERNKSFQVFIPNSKVKVNSKYAIKAFVVKGGKQIESAIVNQFISKN
ncbi:fibronectin type III domain-containing protein [Polaribacter undariae]|uniref:Fibronectin type III domain-containing protein n=2 Tax=Polaribacter sejongensis TaxID=985043 RepID=A0AAJ1QTU6_9FLAO|nr:fibronectin type III domain-containing protein [Polaribacter undariae]MDN3618143.1 fibronectin type III domain-containing protein [Polaribacter undariae]UWD30867.1 fibronectin type III domain-containing protein [Polaribacter undariae]